MKNSLLIDRLLLVSSVAAGLQALVDVFQHSFTLAILDILIVAWLLLLVQLNKSGTLQFVRWLILLSSSFILVGLASFIPRENGLHLLFLPLLCSSFILFDYQQHREKVAGSLIILGCYLLLELTDFRPFGQVTPLEEPDQISFAVNFLTAGVLLFLILHAITRAHHSAEQEIQAQNDLLSQANEELDRFVYSTSHDLKAPLLSISGLLQIIEKKGEAENINPYLIMMQDRVRNLGNFIDDITQHARNARTPLQLSPIALQPFIQEVLESHRYLHQQEKIALRQLGDLSAVVVSDSHRLLTIINNLVSNAIKYHNTDQEHPYVNIGAEITNNQLHLWIEDNGPGIDQHVQKRMFEMFYRGNERSSGSGLGLFIVKEALEKLGGTIEVASVKGQGSTFHVWVPVQLGEQQLSENTVLINA